MAKSIPSYLPFRYHHSLGVDFTYDPKDIVRHVNSYVATMLSRTNMMFEYENLPATIPPSILELYLQTYGAVAITRVPPAYVLRNSEMDIPHTDASTIDPDDETSTGLVDEAAPDLYVFRANFGGEPDIYYRPTRAIIAHPSLTKSLELIIGKECIMGKSDILCQGLLPIFRRYAFEMAHVDISFYTALINTRMQRTIVANKGPDYESATEYIRKLTVGEVSAIASKPFLEGIQLPDAGGDGHTALTSLMDLAQYLKLSWYNELGIDPNMSNKREYVSAEQLASSTDNLMPLVDNMLECRILMCDAVNEMYGTNIKVRKASSWAEKEIETVEELMQDSPAINDETSSTKPDGEEAENNAS